jgi:hypothetical protein
MSNRIMTDEEFQKQFEEDYWKSMDDELNGHIPMFLTDVYIECICGRGFYTNHPNVKNDYRFGTCPECGKKHHNTHVPDEVPPKMPPIIPILTRVDTLPYPDNYGKTRIECNCGEVFYTDFPIETCLRSQDPPYPWDLLTCRCDDCPKCGETHYDKYVLDCEEKECEDKLLPTIPILTRVDTFPHHVINNIFQYAFKEDIFVDENRDKRGRKFSYPPPCLERSTNSLAHIEVDEDDFDDILRQYEPSP